MCSMMRWALLFCLTGAVSGVPRRERHYCVACEDTHLAKVWHVISGVYMCHTAYMQFHRMDIGKPHPAHLVLHRYRGALDVTGRRIVALDFRVDTRAFQEAYGLLSGLGWSISQCLWFLGIVGQLYWSWPIISAVTLLGRRRFSEVCRPAAMLEILRSITSMYDGMRVKHGVLIRGKQGTKQGLSPLGNPSERVCGTVRYRKLARQADKWYKACQAVAQDHIISCHLSHHIIAHRIIAYQITSSHITSHHATSHHIHHTTLYHIIIYYITRSSHSLDQQSCCVCSTPCGITRRVGIPGGRITGTSGSAACSCMRSASTRWLTESIKPPAYMYVNSFNHYFLINN